MDHSTALYDPPLPSLDLPPPPPAPSQASVATPTPLSRAGSLLKRTASLASSFQSTLVEEPTVEELQRETNDLKQKVADVIDAIRSISRLRDEIVASDAPPIDQLQKLAVLTTSTGITITSIPGPMSVIRRGAETLSYLANDGKAAATGLEVSQITEEIEVLKLEVAKAIELVRTMAWEEVASKEKSSQRIERQIRRENPLMDNAAVAVTLRQALASSGERISRLDVLSYGGRMAAERPFTELAVLLDTLQQVQKNAFGSSGTSFVNATEDSHTISGLSQYEKLDLDGEGDLESAPFTSLADGENHPPGWKSDDQRKVKSFLTKARKNYRDWLVRGFLVFSIITVVIGLIAWETVAANHALNASSSVGADSTRATPTVLKRQQ